MKNNCATGDSEGSKSCVYQNWVKTPEELPANFKSRPVMTTANKNTYQRYEFTVASGKYSAFP